MNIKRKLETEATSQLSGEIARQIEFREIAAESATLRIRWWHNTIECEAIFHNKILQEIQWKTPKLSGTIKYQR